MDWRSEVQSALTVDAEGVRRFKGRTTVEIVEEKDEGRTFCYVAGNRRWEGKERLGLRVGRWLFYEGENLRFEVIYHEDLVQWICGFHPDLKVDPDAVFEGRWATERNSFWKERELLLIVLGGFRTVDDAPQVLHRLAMAGAGQIRAIRALREGLGISLIAARAMIIELFPEG